MLNRWNFLKTGFYEGIMTYVLAGKKLSYYAQPAYAPQTCLNSRSQLPPRTFFKSASA